MQCKCRAISGHNHCNYFRRMTFGSSLFDQSCNWDVNVGRNTIANFTTNTSWANVTCQKTPLLDIKLSWCGRTAMTTFVTVFQQLQQMTTISSDTQHRRLALSDLVNVHNIHGSFFSFNFFFLDRAFYAVKQHDLNLRLTLKRTSCRRNRRNWL